MLFDLRGRRRRAVQATYLTLAVLMGGGLLLFGIGGDVSGGLFDAFSGNGGSGGDANSQLEKRIDNQEEKLATSPNNAAILAELVRLNYQVASTEVPSGSTVVPEEGKDNLRRAAAYWDRYVEATDGQPDPSLARLALFVFDTGGLNQPDKAKEAVRVIAADSNDVQSYLLLVRYATAAKDTRTAQLAGQKAIDLAPEAQRKQVQQAVKQLQQAGATAQPDASTGP